MVLKPSTPPVPIMVDKAKTDYEEKLSEVNLLRSQMMDHLARFQGATFQMVKARARYVRLARKAGLDVPIPTWWEKGIGQ